MGPRARFLIQVTTYRRLRITRDGHLDQSEAYDIVTCTGIRTGPTSSTIESIDFG